MRKGKTLANCPARAARVRYEGNLYISARAGATLTAYLHEKNLAPAAAHYLHVKHFWGSSQACEDLTGMKAFSQHPLSQQNSPQPESNVCQKSDEIQQNSPHPESNVCQKSDVLQPGWRP
jgi:hypothetical protein